jgi:hypothetical protein
MARHAASRKLTFMDSAAAHCLLHAKPRDAQPNQFICATSCGAFDSDASVMPPKKAGKKGAQMAPAFDAADNDDRDDLQSIIDGDTG